jgi:hypothetical protein
VRLCKLPAPDTLEFDLPPGTVCVITDDGTALTTQLASDLSHRQWQVVVLPLPNVVVSERPPFPANITVLPAADLASALQSCGPIGAFIHLHPVAPGGLFSGEDKANVKQVFFAAQKLKHPLQEAARHGRSCFMTVTRLDGKLGLGAAGNFGVIAGGLFGLTKTLALEWPDVFCRAVDISPDLPTDRTAQAIIEELHDPNRLVVETGWDAQGRVTLVAQ